MTCVSHVINISFVPLYISIFDRLCVCDSRLCQQRAAELFHRDDQEDEEQVDDVMASQTGWIWRLVALVVIGQLCCTSALSGSNICTRQEKYDPPSFFILIPLFPTFF